MRALHLSHRMISLAAIKFYKGIYRYMDNIIIQLEEYRLKHRITQQDLARKLGVSFVSVNRWLNGHAIPQKLQVYQIKQLLQDKEVQYGK